MANGITVAARRWFKDQSAENLELLRKAVMECADDDNSEAMRELARKEFHVDGHIEIEDDGVVSEVDEGEGGAKGAYVEAWVWVDAERE